jgi:hypothetical protein
MPVVFDSMHLNMDPYIVTSIHRISAGRLIGIVRSIVIKENSYELTLIQEQIPGENNPLFILLYDLQSRYVTAWTGYWFFTDTTVLKLPCNTVAAAH